MAPAAATNECYYTVVGYPINFVLDSCRAAVSDPARDYWRAIHRITTLAMCNVGYNDPRFLQCGTIRKM